MDRKPQPAKKTTTTTTKKDPKSKEDFECPVCMELIAEPVKTPCQHLFCLSCQKQLMKLNSTCPLCRKVFDAQFIPMIDKSLQ